MAEYFKSLSQSFKELLNNPALVVPFILQSVVIIAVFILLLMIGAAIILPQMGFTLSSFATEAAILASLKAITWSPQLIITTAVVALIITVVLVLVAAWFAGGTIKVVNEVVEGRKVTMDAFFAGARTLFWRLIGYWALSGLLYLAAAVPLAIFILLAVFREQGRIIFIILAVLFGILFLVAAIIISLGILFCQPIIVREKLSSAATISKGFSLLKAQTGHVILTFLVIIGTSIVIAIAVSLLLMPITVLAKAKPASGAIQVLNAISSIIQNLISIILGAALSIFLFLMYKEIEEKGVTPNVPTSSRRKGLSRPARKPRRAS